MGKINPGKKTRGRYEVLKADPDKPRSIKNVATVKQDPKDKGKLGTRKRTGRNVSNIVGRSAKTGQVRSRPTDLRKFPKPRRINPSPLGIAATLGPIAYDQMSKTGAESFKNMKEVERGKMRKTIQNIKGTPKEIAKDKKAKKVVTAPRPKRKPKVPTSTEKSLDPEVYIDSSVTYDMNNMPKKMSGGKVTYRKAGGKIGRGCGAAMRGAGKVMKA